MIFDLKGSMVGRFVKGSKELSKLTALKDKNFLMKIEIEKNLVNIPEDKCDHFLSVLRADTNMLRDNNLMDYSLLFFIIEITPEDHQNNQNIWDCFGEPGFSLRLVKSIDGKYIYCFGIIDYLQTFNIKKLFENKYKSLIYGSERNFISAVDPVLYADRMLNFSKSYLFK